MFIELLKEEKTFNIKDKVQTKTKDPKFNNKIGVITSFNNGLYYVKINEFKTPVSFEPNELKKIK